MSDTTAFSVSTMKLKLQPVAKIVKYVGHLESKEHLRIQPVQLFHCS